MSSIITNWLKAARWHASVLHLLEMWAFLIPGWAAAYFLGPIGGGVAAVCAWYWSRKRTETQAEIAPGNLISVPWVGLFPWQWSWAMQLDFYLPAGASLIAASLLNRL